MSDRNEGRNKFLWVIFEAAKNEFTGLIFDIGGQLLPFHEKGSCATKPAYF